MLGALVLVIGAGAACSGADPALVADLEATGRTLFAPVVREVAPSGVRVDAGAVVLSYDDDGLRYSVDLVEATDAPLCRTVSLERGSDCEEADGVMRADFEEMAVVAVRRGDTVLVARGLVTEADPDLADDVADALGEAPEVSAEKLADTVA